MKKSVLKSGISFFLFLLVFIYNTDATTYYVDAVNGSNTNSGLSATNSFMALWVAAGKTAAGDTVFVLNGTYTNSAGNPVLTETHSGTANDWIVWMNYPGHSPVISFNAWQGLYIKGSYVEVNGFTVRGNNANVTLEQALVQPKSCNTPSGSYDSKFNGNGIYIDGRSPNVRVHHITIKNCQVYECGGGGIAIIQSDYITLENNTVYDNSWYSLFANSGISLYQNWNSDNATGTKNIIRNNKCYGNQQKVPWPSHSCMFTDGNGIIIDDTKNTQNGSTLGAYPGRTLVENNIVYNNGGSGIHCFQSEHVDIINNTAYQNSQTPEIDNGEIFPQNSNDIRIFNNIMYASAGEKINSNMSNGTDIFYDYNLHFGDGPISLTGAHSLTADPKFADVATYNFKLQAESSAINIGTRTFSGVNAPLIDFAANPRPYGALYDIGAYEYSPSTGVNESIPDEQNTFFTIFPNPAKNEVTVTVSSTIGSMVGINIYKLSGVRIFSDISKATNEGVNKYLIPTNFPSGVYLVQVNNGERLESGKLILNF